MERAVGAGAHEDGVDGQLVGLAEDGFGGRALQEEREGVDALLAQFDGGGLELAMSTLEGAGHFVADGVGADLVADEIGVGGGHVQEDQLGGQAAGPVAGLAEHGGPSVVARLYVSTNDPDVAEADSEERLLTIPQPFSNHNGGQMAFSPGDGHLYIGLGDGGSGNDPLNASQNKTNLLGKILRLEVEPAIGATYAVPTNNPFVGNPAYRPEIWALGVRNPWRFSFDRLTGDLYVADVGQGEWEEINVQAAGSPGGENYGWRILEGTHCTGLDACDTNGLTMPACPPAPLATRIRPSTPLSAALRACRTLAMSWKTTPP